jgi:hypothetical protein
LTRFLKEKTSSANTPRAFLDYLREHAEFCPLLERSWQEERLAEMRAVFGAERVLEGQPGFASLAVPPFR